LDKLRLLSLAAVVAGVVLGMGALTLKGNGAEAAPEDDIEAMLQAAVEAWNEEDIATFISYWTEQGLQGQFDFGEEDPAAFIAADREDTGPIASIAVTDLFITSGNASGIVDLQFEEGFSLFEEWKFIFQDGGWKIDGNEPAFRPIPEGVPAVPITLQEYVFVYNEDAILAADGNFAFEVTNVGQQEHEILIFRITSAAPLTDVVQTIAGLGEDEEPEGIEFVTFGGFFEPGTEGTVILPEPLSPGRYGLVCFVPAPDGTPHALLGMASDFSVGSAAPITPPSTGDGGLLGEQTSEAAWLLLGVALTLVLGGTVGVVNSRRPCGV